MDAGRYNPIDVYYHGYRYKGKEMKMIFRRFSEFA